MNDFGKNMKIKSLRESYNSPKTEKDLVNLLSEVDNMLNDCWRACNQLKIPKKITTDVDKVGNTVHKIIDDLKTRGYGSE